MLIASNNLLIGRTDQVCRIGVNVEMLTLSALMRDISRNRWAMSHVFAIRAET